MNIIIVGCGQVGTTLARELGEDGNNITVVDTSFASVQAVTNKLDVMGVIGNGASHTTLMEAGIDTADLIIAVTNSDELNLLCCILAKKQSNCKTIARVRSHRYNEEADYLKNELGLAMVINPEFASAEEIARVLRFPSALSIEPFCGGRVELLKFRLPEDSKIIGMSVREVTTKYKSEVLFCTAERGGESFIIKGDFVFNAKDVISIICEPKSAEDFFGKIGYKTEAVKDAIIASAGEITNYLCSIFAKGKVNIKVIDPDRSVCENLSTEFPTVTAVNGKITDQELLLEEGIERTDAFIALGKTDEENILASLFAHDCGTKKIVTKIKKAEYADMVTRLDLDTVFSPQSIVADMIVRFVRATRSTLGSNVETMYNVIQGEVEASEFRITAESPIVGKPLMQLKFKPDVLIAAITRADKVILPRGNDVISVGDSVIVVSKITGLNSVLDILE